uniref:CARD domain-containing protein n=1 Tax=Hucho hucho TaxID=62062 RepID=A0A4W5Q2E9_9TELE
WSASRDASSTTRLLSICLSKGERACCSFYQALGSEDPQLASDITGDHLH